jgi:hypothetical protein
MKAHEAELQDAHKVEATTKQLHTALKREMDKASILHNQVCLHTYSDHITIHQN